MFIKDGNEISIERYAYLLSWVDRIMSCPEYERIRHLPSLSLLMDAMVFLEPRSRNTIIDILKEFPLEYIGEEAFLSKRSDPEFVPGLILLRNADAEGYAYIFL